MKKLNRFQEWLVKWNSQHVCEHKKTFIEDDIEKCWYCGKEFPRPNPEMLKVFGFFFVIFISILVFVGRVVRKVVNLGKGVYRFGHQLISSFLQ